MDIYFIIIFNYIYQIINKRLYVSYNKYDGGYSTLKAYLLVRSL